MTQPERARVGLPARERSWQQEAAVVVSTAALAQELPPMNHEHLPSNSSRVNLRAGPGRRSYRTAMKAVARAEAQAVATDDLLVRAVWERLADQIGGLAARTRTLSQSARSWPR